MVVPPAGLMLPPLMVKQFHHAIKQCLFVPKTTEMSMPPAAVKESVCGSNISTFPVIAALDGDIIP